MAMLVVMVALMIGFFWHGGDRGGHMTSVSPASETAKSPLDLLDEAYARGEIGREEYLRKREDLMRR